jgi:cobalt-zinc-cadmium resistance protein CzcA
VAAVVQAAIGGQVISQVFEGEKHFDLILRWAEPYRRDVRSIRNVLVSTPDGAQVPLGQIAEVAEEEGPSVIYREDLKRYVPVKFSVRGRDLGGTIGEAQARINASVKLPYDTHLEWAGEMNQLRETTARLLVIVPITLLLIAFLIFSAAKNGRDTLIVLLGVPVPSSGGIVALYLTGTDFSISAAMGFISILGVAVQDALLVVTYARQLRQQGHDAKEAARLAAERWLRPVLMASFVAMLGLLPAAVSRGIGSETQKPLAIVVIGGALALVILPRLLQPALLMLAHRDRETDAEQA